jgi:plastocyanin
MSRTAEETVMRRRRLPVVVLLLAVAAATVATAAPASAGAGCHRKATEGSGTTLALSELCFSPTVLRVEPGAEVRVENRDTTAHPLSRPGGDWYWDGTVGEATTIRLDQAGTYPFYCFAHPGMVGVVVVGDGRGPGAGILQVAATDAPAPDARAAGPAEAATGGRQVAAFPAAWMVVVALAALVGAVVGTRLAARSAKA